ncbi:uncharacterized protein LOC128731580 [Anopheles nili]|uniref:uncharacterized protein LOC128731580 n=1 Tax=Anopheles nili TaxID=185578 RepID=UPI00237B8E4C|nr:uncharacterized protein LOC128731580 [Anopheles nili]
MRWRMRFLPQLLLLLSTTALLLTVVHSEEQPNPTADGDSVSKATGQTEGTDDGVQNLLTTGLRLEHELVKEQADAPSTVNGSNEGGIVAIHKDALGGKEQLRPTFHGLSYLASKFLPQEYKFIEILSAIREVVAGVRFELVVSAQDETTSQNYICRLVILEKPWITTEYGEKYRSLEYSNCSSSSGANNGADGALPYVEETVTRLNPIFDANLRQAGEPTPERLEELEGQIIIEKVEVLEITSTVSPVSDGAQEATGSSGSSASSTTESEELSDAAKSAIDELFSIASAPLQNKPPSSRLSQQDNSHRAEVIEETIVPIRAVSNQAGLSETTTPSVTTTTMTATTLPPLDQQVQSTFEEVFKTHQEIQKALDEVIANGGGRDVQLKYRPVFDSLLQKVKASIDSYYRLTNGGDANVDTAAFVVRDNTNVMPSRIMNPTRPVASSYRHDEQSSQESDETQQRQPLLLTVDLQPPKTDTPTVTISGSGDSDEEENDQQILTKEQLALELNGEEGLQRVKKHATSFERVFRTRNKRENAPEEPEKNPALNTMANDEDGSTLDTTVSTVDIDSNVSPTTAKVIMDSTTAKTVPATGGDTSSSSTESDEARILMPATKKKQKDRSTSEADEDENKDEKLSKVELTKQLNADEGLPRNKRDFSSGYFGGHSGGFGGWSHSGGGYYGGGYYGGGYYNPYYNPYYPRPPYYYGHYRGKRSVAMDDVPVEVQEKHADNARDDIELSEASKQSNPHAPIIERVTMAFGDSDEDDGTVPTILTKDELTKQLNADDGYRREKRGFSSTHHLSSSYNNRGKRNSNLSPEINAINLEVAEQEAQMKIIASEAIKRLDQMDSDLYQRILLEVLDARKVAQRSDQTRTTYVLRVLTANSHCAEEESKHAVACRGLLMADTTKQCTLEVHVFKANVNDSEQVQLTKSKCQKQRSNYLGGGLVGGATPVDLTDPEHDERIRLGLVGYENGKHSNFEIIYGTVQVVAGTIHRYKIALKDAGEQDYSTCDVKVFTPLPSAPNGDKPEYDFDCQDDKKADSRRRRRRDVPTAPPKKLNKVPKSGGVQELTPEEFAKAEHQDRVRTGLQKQAALVDGSGQERKVKIVGATMQLVAGRSFTYRLTFPDDESKRVCKLTVWEKPWLKEKAPEEAFKASLECPDSMKRTKRDSCFGCADTLPTEEYGKTEHQERINKILSFHGVTRGSSFKVLNATSQVVAGMKFVYYIQHDNTICKLSSWERVWLAKSQPKDAYIYSYDCEKETAASKARSRRSVSGGSRSLTQEELTDNEHIQRVDKILVSNGGPKGSPNARIVSGTVQVVSGKIYKYAVEFDVDGGSKLCKLSSWERPWLEEKNPTDAYKYTVSCPDATETHHQRRQRRHAKKTGGSNDLTAKELKDRSHVERIAAGMVLYNSERSKAYNDFEILAGSTQQVAGSLYKYTFRVTTEPDIVCKISIWERVWLESQDQRKYNVKCTGDDDTEQQPEIKPQPSQESSSPATTTPQRRSVRSLKIDDEEHVKHQFEKFKQHHRRRYANSMEHEMRFNIFRNNLFKIDQLNKFERGTAKYGITKFADMTVSEYRLHTGLIVPNREENNHIHNPIATQDDVADVGDMPRSFDWRDQGAVTEVKNQGSCGSCWAFSAVGNIEGLHKIKTNKLESYSEQELIDCDKVDNGCGGGYMDDAFKAIEQLGGLELETDYPYRAKNQKTCQFNKTLSHVQVKGAVDMPKNETFMAQYLIKNGPIAVGLNANAMQFYRGGISHPWHMLCNRKSIDHGVLLVGYGIKEYPLFNKTLPYWVIKNSWGPSWGEQGYYRIYRGDNSCGVSEMASSAILA